MKIGEAVYKAQQEESDAAAASDAAADSGDDNVVDADFEDVTDGSDDQKAS